MDNIEQDYEDFISTVSHELRTPLTSIRGFSQTLLSSWDKLDDENKKKFIKIMEEQSERLIHLVENMLAVTKLKSGSNLTVFSEFELKPLISQVVTLVKNQYQSQKFEINIEPNTPKIFADKDKFMQVLVNLIENSAKYSPDNSTTEIDVKQDNKIIKINISNTGIGIKEKDYDKIFTKFARIDNPLTRKVQGSGLGLYITKNLIEKMDGKIFVKSEPLNNSEDLSKITFTIEMPIKDIEEQTRIKCGR